MSRFQPRTALQDAAGVCRAEGQAPTAASRRVQQFVQALIADAPHLATSYSRALERTLGPERLLMEVFSPAAHLLGDAWTEDLCDFATVTIAMTRLHTLLREMSHDWGADTEQPSRGCVLIAAAPCEQHVFGGLMLAQFFRRAQWQVVAPVGADARELLGLARRERFDMIGLSLASELGLAGVGALISQIRHALTHPTAVLVGGPAFHDRPDRVEAVGADGTAADGPTAVRFVERYVQARQTAH